MKKKLLAILTLSALVLAMTISAFAAERRAPSISVRLAFDGTTAECTAIITSVGDEIDATMQLKRGSTVLKTWTGDGTNVVNLYGEHGVTKGVTYTLVVSGTIDGVPFSESESKTC